MTTAELQIVLRCQDRASSPLRKLKSQIVDLDKSVGKTGSAFRGLALSLGGLGVGSLAGAALKAGANYDILKENAELALTTMLKDGGKAQAMIQQIADTAKKTPFGFEDLTRASQRMLAFGFNAEQVIPILTTVGDAVSAMGGGADMIDRVTLALGQMNAKGKVSAEEMMQLTEAGIPAWQILADNIDQISPKLAEAVKAGKIGQDKLVPMLMKMAEKGQIKAPAAIEALRRGMASRFGGLSEKQLKTTSGASSALSDALKELFGSLEEGPLKAVTGYMITLADNVPKLTEAFKGLPDPVKTVVGWLGTAALVLADVGGKLLGPVGVLLALGGGSGLSGVIATVGRVLGAFVGAGGPLALLAGAFTIAKLAWDRDLAPVFAALQTYLTTFPHVKIALEWANKQAETVARWLMDLPGTIDSVVRVAVQWANDAAQSLAAWANQAAKNVRQTVQVAVEWANEAASQLASWTNAAARSVTQTVNVAVQWANDAARSLGDWAGQAGAAVTKTISVAVAWAGETAAAIGGWVQDAGATVARTVDAYLVWAGDTATALGGWFEGKGEAIGRNVQTFLLWAGDVANTLGDWFLGRGEAIGRNVQTYLLWAGEVAGALGDWFMGRGEAIGRNVQAYVGWAGDLAGRLGEWFEGRGGALGRNVQAYLDWAGDLASKIGGWVSGASGALGRTLSIGFTFLSDTWRKFAEWIAGTGGRVVNVGFSGTGSVPAMAAGGIVSSPTLALIGEAGPEAVVPLSGARGAGMGTAVVVNVYGNNYGFSNFEDAVVSAVDRASRRGRL